MQWQDLRQLYPQQWLLVEALNAHSTARKRVLEQLAVIATFPDSATAMKRYAELHRVMPAREYYVFHSSRETLEVTERRWFGVRGSTEEKVQRAIHRTALRNAVAHMDADCELL